MSTLRITRLCVLVLVCAGFLACSDGGSSSSEDSLPSDVSAQVGVKGGTLKASGMTLEIPEGALDKSIKISVVNAGQKVPKEIQAKALSDVYEYGPDGTKFKREVSITFLNKTGDRKAEVYFTKEDGTGFEKIASEKDGDRVTAHVKHFSQGFLGLPLDDSNAEGVDAGPPDGDAGAMEMDAGSEPAVDASQTEPAPDATTLPVDAGPDATLDPDAGLVADASVAADSAVVSKTHFVVQSRDRFGALVNQTWAALQDGAGAWQALPTPAQPGMYAFDVASASFGVAFVCSSPDVSNAWGTLNYVLTSSKSLSVVTQGPPCTAGQAPVTHTLQGTLNLAMTDQYWRYGDSFGGSGINFSTVSPSFTLNEQHNLANDILFATGPSTASYSISKFVVHRDVTVTANTTGFNSDSVKSGVSPLGSAQAQVLNASDATTVDVRYLTRATEEGLWLNTNTTSGSTTRTVSFAMLPASLRSGSDRYFLLGADDASSQWRRASYATYASGGLSVTLPAVFAVSFTTATTPYLRPTYGFTQVAGASLYAFSLNYSPVRSSNFAFAIEIDPAVLDASATQAFTFPDFSQVPGFNTAWVAPSAGSVAAKAAVHMWMSDTMGSLKTESGQSATVKAP